MLFLVKEVCSFWQDADNVPVLLMEVFYGIDERRSAFGIGKL